MTAPRSRFDLPTTYNQKRRSRCSAILTRRSSATRKGITSPPSEGETAHEPEFSSSLTRKAYRKTAAVIDLKRHSALWEDIEDVLVSRSRRHEKRIPLEKVKADLIASGKLRG